MLKSFEARGYRNLDTRIELGRVNLLIGPNNSGKSNLLRAIGFAKDGIERTADPVGWGPAVRHHGGEAFVSHALDASTEWKGGQPAVHLGWELQGTEGHCHLRLQLGRGREQPQVVQEQISFNSAPQVTPPMWVHAQLAEDRTAISLNDSERADPPTDPQIAASSRLILNSPVLTRGQWKAGRPDTLASGLLRKGGKYAASQFTSTTHLEMAALSPREEARTREVREPSPDLGGELTSLAGHLRFLEQHTGPGTLEIAEHLAELIPDLKRIIVRDIDNISWIELFRGAHKLRLSEMSDGTIVALILATLLFRDLPRSLLMIDEPELNLHPAWLKVIGGWFQRATSPEQIILSTHSPDLLDAFTEGFRTGEVHLLVAGGPEGVRTVAPEELAASLDEGWELGDLYRVGDPALGGWPW